MPFIQLQFRRGTAAEWSTDNPVLAEAEMAIETDTNLFKIGDGVLAWNALPYGGLEGSTGPTGYTGATGATGDPGLGTMMVWNAGNSANAGELSGWGGSMSFNETSLSGSAIGFFSSLSSLYPWQTTYLNVTDSTGQYVTIGVSGVSYSSPVYTVTGGVVVQNGTGTFSGTCHVSYYVNTASTGATGPTGPGFETITNPTLTYVLTALTSNSAQGESNLTFDGSTLSTLNVEVNGQFAIGTQRFYAQGSDGFSVNENFNAGGATQTAYHYTSGDASRDIVFDLAVSGQYTTMFGTYGSAGANDFIIGSETSNTNFTFKSDLGIAPVNLAGGTTLFGVSNNGTVFAPLLSNTVYNSTVLTFDSNTGVITYSDVPSIFDLIGDSLTLSTLTVANTISTANIYTNSISTNSLIADSISTYSMTVFGPSTFTANTNAFFNQTTQMSSLTVTSAFNMSTMNGIIPSTNLLSVYNLATQTQLTSTTTGITTNSVVSPRLGNVLTVDQVNGDDTKAQPGGFPFKTINSAVNNLITGDSVWIQPGTYNLTSPITLPENTAMRGMNTQTVRVQMSNLASNTTMITMGENTRVEDVSISLANTNHSTMVGVYFPQSTCVTAKLRTAVVTVDNSSASSGGTSDTTAVLVGGQNNYDESVFSFNFIRGCTLNLKTNGGGIKRGILVSTNSACSTRDTNVYVASPRDTSSTGSYVGIETRQISSIIDLRTTAISGPIQTGSFQASDILQTNGMIRLSQGVELQTFTAANSSFTTTVYPTQFNYGVIGNLSNNDAAMSNSPVSSIGYLWPGSLCSQQVITGPKPVAGYPDSNIGYIFIQQPTLLYGMFVSLASSPGNGSSTIVQVLKNQSTTIDFVVPFTSADTYPAQKYSLSNSVKFQRGDQLSLKLITTGHTTNTSHDLFAQLDFY